MYDIGVFPGKFSPPHRGHIDAILSASCQCKKLIVVVSHSDKLDPSLYDGTITKPITFNQKVKWLSQELSEFEHIEIKRLDESDIPVYPYGWEQWSKRLYDLTGNPSIIFGGEPEYAEEGYTKYFPRSKYSIFKKTHYPISATDIRQNPYKHWEYILGSAREHFVKRVLITGTESCGKTTLTKMLAKIFFTSWAREEGRYYSVKYFGGNESVFELEDFYNIAWEQRQIEDHAIRTANRITFLDTDAVVTQFYCQMYLGKENPSIESLIDPNRYDMLFLLTPDVKWVADGYRWNKDDTIRYELHGRLLAMYHSRGFQDKIKVISGGGDYNKRLNEAIALSQSLI
jgi:HTH-type transcriptional repressor of NAD biosynthesis genes